MKVFKDDALYGQNDPAEEIFFIITGRVKLYYNIFCKRPDKNAKYVPVNICVEGSYFGDVEVILNHGRDVRKTMAVAKEESQLLVTTKAKIVDLLSNFPSVSREMKVVATRRLGYLTHSIEAVKQEFFGVINDDGEAMHEFTDGQKSLQKIDEDDKDNFLMQSQFIRLNSQMRHGEITLQKIRVNKKARDKKAVAMDVLKMLN